MVVISPFHVVTAPHRTPHTCNILLVLDSTYNRLSLSHPFRVYQTTLVRQANHPQYLHSLSIQSTISYILACLLILASYCSATTMDLLCVNSTGFSLDKLRDTLIRLEDTIIFGLIERAQFARNPRIYEKGSFKFVDGFNGSFFEYFLHEVEVVHARVRRYQSPDEYPFTDNLPEPILPALDYPPTLHANNVNVNKKLLQAYLESIVPTLCVDTDDQNYGSSATRDIECLQALSRRIHYGKFIAEAKFIADPEGYTKLIRANDRVAIERLLTAPEVEARLLRRLRRKAFIYGQDITEDGTVVCDSNEATNNLKSPIKINLDLVVELYEKFVIPLTKEVEVEYLMQRLDN
ncbi:chorismate mutase [Syncephalis plumigaleata]|nr:chorismate mutase [Syncephalis plumigaleata]